MVSWISRTDLVYAIRFVLENPQCRGIYNATAPEAVSNADFSKTLAKALHRPHFLQTPAWVLKLLLGEMADLLLNGQNVQPTRLLNAGFQFRYPTLPEALQHIFED